MKKIIDDYPTAFANHSKRKSDPGPQRDVPHLGGGAHAPSASVSQAACHRHPTRPAHPFCGSRDFHVPQYRLPSR